MGRTVERVVGRKVGSVIWLRQEAPPKPAFGAPCNGCGVCCAHEPCPVALVFLWQRRGSCKALEWNEETQRYRCGMACRPAHHLRWLPAQLEKTMQRLVLRWIAADTACDASHEIEGAG